MKRFEKNILEIDNGTLWKLYGRIILELKQRKLIRTRNIVGEFGEFAAIEYHNKTSGLPKLQAAPEGTKNVDALSRSGERYSIKTITHPNKLTGVFYGLEPPTSEKENIKKFEHLIIVVISKNFELLKIIECDWNIFIKHKKWHSTMRAWNISLNKNFIGDCKIIYDSSKEV